MYTTAMSAIMSHVLSDNIHDDKLARRIVDDVYSSMKISSAWRLIVNNKGVLIRRNNPLTEREKAWVLKNFDHVPLTNLNAGLQALDVCTAIIHIGGPGATLLYGVMVSPAVCARIISEDTALIDKLITEIPDDFVDEDYFVDVVVDYLGRVVKTNRRVGEHGDSV